MEDIIFENSIITPDGTKLISKDRHDYIEYVDKNGKTYIVDGGNEYLKRGYEIKDYKETSITSNSNIEDIREVLKWGTYGKDGKSDYKQKLLKDLSNNHIKAIIKTQKHLSKKVINIFKKELNFRNKNNIYIKD